MPAKQREILKGAGDAAVRGGVRAHTLTDRALESDTARLRLVEAVDDVEHRGFAGAVRSDDGANFALANIERNTGQRAHATKRERYILDCEQQLAEGRLVVGRRPHAARSIFADFAAGTGAGLRSRTVTRAAIVPLWPSSKVTWVVICASVEPL